MPKDLDEEKKPSNLREVVKAVEEELRGSGCNIGYRQRRLESWNLIFNLRAC